ncbi:MAG: filamentous hemagglutinin N-terminal domain-containing protein [Planctomycetaceae bacterium]|jgi:filamentous hemagglutinin family protein|nr:filamentous hemagglutinin N-terminal domain-containing protein [Phycisphaerales bacterium]MCE2653762.1 filamentous hemagglutinin N-terminal domain-containing protein [Planctomycetaceae bacterium]
MTTLTARRAHWLVSAAGLSVSVLALAAGSAVAQVQNPTVVRGTASFNQNGSTTTITASNGAIINYSGFNIGAGQTVRFVQPNSRSTVLNRINGELPTRIDGNLLANGRVFIVNPSGVIFGQSAIVNAASIYAAAGNIADDDFARNRFNFAGTGTVLNQGSITAGHAALVGKNVVNNGSIVAPQGSIVMAAGDRVIVGERGSRLYAVVTPSSDPSRAGTAGVGVQNTGTLTARGGTVQMAAGDIYSAAVINTGTVQARSIAVQAVHAPGRAADAVVTIGGSLIATSDFSGFRRGGDITIQAGRIAVQDALIDASGVASGGMIRIGGDERGQGTMPRADAVYVDAASTIKADASVGNGGRIVVWGDNALRFYGSASAQGGEGAGSWGGFIETSTLGFGDINPTAITARSNSSPSRSGQWLIDPLNITISGSSSNTTSGPTFEPTGTGATVNVDDIRTTLEGGTNVIVTTSNPGGNEPGNITWGPGSNLTVDLTLNGARTLTLRAANNISIGSNITATGAGLSLTLIGLDPTQAGEPGAGTTGAVSITGTLDLGGGVFSASGGSFTNSVAMLNVGSFNLNVTGNAELRDASTTTNLNDISVGGTLLVESAGDIARVDNGRLVVTGTSSFETTAPTGSITLAVNTGDASALSGAASFTAGGDVTVANQGNLALGTSTIGGALTAASATGGITNDTGGDINVTGDAIFQALGATGDINLGQIHSFSTGGTFSADTGGGDVTVLSAGAIRLGLSDIGGTLAVTADTGNITGFAAGSGNNVGVAGGATFQTSASGATITLNNLAVGGELGLNTTGSGSNATVTNATALTLGPVSVGGDLSVTATTGNITNNTAETITVGGSRFTATTLQSNADINLQTTGTMLTNGAFAVNTTGSGGDATISIGGAGVRLAGGTVGGRLSVTAAGNITDENAGAVIAGSGRFETTLAGADVTFTNRAGASLRVGGPLELITDQVTIDTDAPVTLGASNIGGSLSVTTTAANAAATVTAPAGAIRNSVGTGAIIVGGTVNFDTSDGTGDVNIATATQSSEFIPLQTSGAITINSGGSATITNNGAINFADSSIAGSLSAVALTGGISIGTGINLAVAGPSATFEARNGGDLSIDQGLSLSGTGARIGVTTVGGGDVTIVQPSLNLTTSNVTGALTATALTGNISNAGTGGGQVTVSGGNASFTTQANNSTITLDPIQVSAGTLLLSTAGTAGNVAVNHIGNLSLAATTINGHATFGASGTITQTGLITVTQSLDLRTTGAGSNVTLNNLAVTGPFAFGTSGNVTVSNSGAVVIGNTGNTVGAAPGTASTIGGNLTLTANTGNMSNTHGVTVAGNGVSSFTANNGNITFNQTGANGLLLSDAAASVSFTTGTAGNNVQFVHGQRINLNTSSVNGSLTLNAANGNITNIGFGDVTVANGATFTTQGANSSITVGNNTDTFTLTAGNLVLTTAQDGGSNAVIRTNNTALTLGAVNVGNNLNVNTGTAALTIAGNQRVGNFAGAGGAANPGSITFAGSVINLGGNVTSNRGDIAFNAPVALNAADVTVSSRYTGPAASFVNSTRGSVLFAGNITAGGADNARSLTINTPNGAEILGSSTVIPVVRFGGTSIGAAGSRLANLRINADSTRLNVPLVATILAGSPSGVAIRVANQFAAGRREKFTVGGSLNLVADGLSLPAGQAAIRIGDLSVGGNTTISGPSMQVIRRNAGVVRVDESRTVRDAGVDLVFGGPANINVTSFSVTNASGPGPASTSTVNVGSRSTLTLPGTINNILEGAYPSTADAIINGVGFDFSPFAGKTAFTAPLARFDGVFADPASGGRPADASAIRHFGTLADEPEDKEELIRARGGKTTASR